MKGKGMRTREEIKRMMPDIYTDVTEKEFLDYQSITQKMILEVLLDIRDLLIESNKAQV